jgi:hypothetical protein
VVLRQTERREHERVIGVGPGAVVAVVLAPELEPHGVALLGVEQVLDDRLLWLVVRRKRTIDDARGREQPRASVRLHQEGRIARDRRDAAGIGAGR